MALKILRGHLAPPSANPLDDYRTPAQQQQDAAEAREQQGQGRADANAAGRWHGRRK